MHGEERVQLRLRRHGALTLTLPNPNPNPTPTPTPNPNLNLNPNPNLNPDPDLNPNPDPNPNSNQVSTDCIARVGGCMASVAKNYAPDANAVTDCVVGAFGCNPECIFWVFGCMAPEGSEMTSSRSNLKTALIVTLTNVSPEPHPKLSPNSVRWHWTDAKPSPPSPNLEPQP